MRRVALDRRVAEELRRRRELVVDREREVLGGGEDVELVAVAEVVEALRLLLRTWQRDELVAARVPDQERDVAQRGELAMSSCGSISAAIARVN